MKTHGVSVSLLVLFLASTVLGADPAERGPQEGTWELDAAKLPKEPNYPEPKKEKKGRRLLMVTATHFCCVQYLLEKGETTLAWGGSYTRQGYTIKEKVEFGNARMLPDVGKTFTLTKSRFDGDYWYRTVTTPGGEAEDQRWVRVK